MYRSRSNYWSNSKFAAWLRKICGAPTQPKAATSEEWRDWHRASKKHSKVLDYIIEELFDDVQNFFMFPIDVIYNVRQWLLNGFIEKSHTIRTGLKFGQFHETEEKILHGMFEELVDFVEIQKAWMQVVFDSSDEKDKYELPWHQRQWYTRWFGRWRCPKAGLDHLAREIALVQDDAWFGYHNGDMPQEERDKHPTYGEQTHQGKAAQEILDLYKWWKEVRPNRPDPYDASGLTEYYDKKRKDDDDYLWSLISDTKDDGWKQLSDECHRLEQHYEDEDTLMMKRLIDVRKSLWT